MLEGIAASAAPARNANVFTVIWQGISEVIDDAGRRSNDYEDAVSFCTEVVPAQYGHISVEAITREEWGYMACGEQHDGDNPYDEVDVLFVLEGGHIQVDLEDAD